MTQTERWLKARRSGLAARVWWAGALLTLGLLLGSLGLGVLLGRLGAYSQAPVSVLVGWAVAVALVVWAVRWCWGELQRVRPAELAREIESARALRNGSIAGLAEQVPESGSETLVEYADQCAVGWLEQNGAPALGKPNRRTARSLGLGGSVLAAGIAAFTFAGPLTPGGAKFWSPWATIRGPRGPVAISVDKTEIRRGDSVVVSVTAFGRPAANLWLRAPGEAWSSRALVLDSIGSARAVLGPLTSDRYIHAVSGGHGSDTLHVAVRIPALISDLRILASFPRYLDREDEPITGGPEPVSLPVGTQLSSSGRVTVPLAAAAWRDGTRVAELNVEDRGFDGGFRVTRSGSWRLHVTATDGGGLEEAPPELKIVAVPDSAPVVAIPIPMADTSISVSLRQPVVIDAHDDYGLVRVEVLSWRVSPLGGVGDSLVDTVSLPGGPVDRAVLQWTLDLNARGFLPGDTARFKVLALDNAPRTQTGESRTFSLWLPTVAELRLEIGDRSAALAEGADSLTEAQRELAQRLDDLAAERQRDADATPLGGESQGDLPFETVERAQQLSDEQERALERAQELKQELQELSEAAWSAGITDPEFHKQLRDLQELLDMALTEDMLDRLDALREAIEELDPEGVREALRQLADAADEMRNQLERGRELFERAAIEGGLTTAAAEAEELAARQDEWNDAVTEAGSDSSLAAEEQALSERADSLASQLDQLGERLAEAGTTPSELGSSTERAERAAGQMRDAAQQAGQGQRRDARRSGESASASLEPLAAELERQRDELREEWRGEVVEAMDRALVETARLAGQQQDVMRRLNRGESGPDVRATQAAARAGVDKVRERLEDAAGKNALVSPQTGAALGFARLRMSEALEQLQRATPNTRQAGEMAGEAVDGLNAVAFQLLRSRSEVAGAESGSGLMEAMEQLAQMAEQQGQINSQSSGMLSLMPSAGEQLMRELQALAQQQRSLANELDQLDAGGDVSGAGELAEDAREIARELESARLDPGTIERQEQLFRRLLDAGRTLRSEEEDEREERVSESADPLNFRLPLGGGPVAGGEPRFRYPTWAELRTLSPAERRLVLNYFRRLNDGRP